jgi:hypothetical protein
MKQRGSISLHLVLTIFLGIGMVLFGVLAILAYNDNTYIHNNLKVLESQAAADASTQQKNSDDAANIRANELPYRTYTADPVDGSFQLQIPKDWSLYVGENNSSGTTPLDIAADPNYVLYNLSSGNNVINTDAFHLQLQNRSVQQVVQGYDSQIKNKELTSKAVTVSGISATWLQGTIDNERHDGVVVIVPTRDQTMVIWTDSLDYLNEFNTILASAKIYP